MKDFDDLWRLAAMEQPVDWRIIRTLLGKSKTPLDVRMEWINDETNAAWKRHIKRYKDLPNDLAKTLSDINTWLKHGHKDA